MTFSTRSPFCAQLVAMTFLAAGALPACARTNVAPAEAPAAVSAREHADDVIKPVKKAMNARDWKGAGKLLDDAERVATTWQERSKIAYYRATLLAYAGDFAKSRDALRAQLSEAKAHPESSSEAWLHNQLTWVLWILGDAPGALAEAGEMNACLDGARLAVGAVDGLRLHALWDRAYLLAEAGSVAGALPSTDAFAAKDDYEALATRLDDASGMAVLRAYFAVRAKDKAAARAALATPELASDEDMQDLYVLAQASDLAGDEGRAKALRARIDASGDAYLMHAIIVRKLAIEAGGGAH